MHMKSFWKIEVDEVWSKFDLEIKMRFIVFELRL